MPTTSAGADDGENRASTTVPGESAREPIAIDATARSARSPTKASSTVRSRPRLARGDTTAAEPSSILTVSMARIA